MRVLLLCFLIACKSSEPATTSKQTEVEPAKPEKSREHRLAEKILAAIAADDFSQLRPLFRIPGATDKDAIEAADSLANEIERGIPQLQQKAAALEIDLSTVKILRVEGDESLSRAAPQMFDIFLESNGRVFRTHFSANLSRRQDQLFGVATWIVPADDVTKN